MSTRFEVLVSLPLNAGTEHWIVPVRNDQGIVVCRFCGKNIQETTFRNVAHSIPELLGNKSIFSKDECDECNSRFAGEFEDHLGRATGLMRSIVGLPTKRGMPTFKDDTSGVRVSSSTHGLAVRTSDPSVAQIFSRPENKEGGFDFDPLNGARTATYTPIRAVAALVKSACSIMPHSELRNCEAAVAWLSGRANVEADQYPVLFMFTPGVIPDLASRVVIYRKVGPGPGPHPQIVVRFKNFQVQTFVPTCNFDPSGVTTTGTVTMSHYDCPVFGSNWPLGETYSWWVDWGSDTPVRDPQSARIRVTGRPLS